MYGYRTPYTPEFSHRLEDASAITYLCNRIFACLFELLPNTEEIQEIWRKNTIVYLVKALFIKV